MKGQYLAVESVLTIGMGLSLAIGVIAIFGSYQDQVGEITHENEIRTVNYRVQSSMHDLRNSDSGQTRIELPEEIGGMEYRVVLDNGIKIITSEEEHFHGVQNFREVETGGSVSGGEVILYKSGNQYTLRSS